MPDERRELQTICPASHTTALGGLFIADERAEVQEGIFRGAGFISLVRAGLRVEEMRVLLRLTGRPRRPSPHGLFDMATSTLTFMGIPRLRIWLGCGLG